MVWQGNLNMKPQDVTDAIGDIWKCVNELQKEPAHERRQRK